MYTKRELIVGLCLLAAFIALVIYAVVWWTNAKYPRPVATDMEWSRALGGNPARFVTGLSKDEGGSLVACGTYGADGGGKSFVCKYTARGERVWDKAISAADRYFPTAVCTGKDCSIFVAGNIGDVNGEPTDIFILKLTVNGELAWARIWGTDRADEARSICVGADSGVFIAGAVDFSEKAILLHYSKDGELITAEQYAGSSAMEYSGADSDSAGNLYLAGSISLPDKPDRTALLVAKHSPEGKMLWQRTLIDLKEDGSNSFAEFTSIIVDREGNAYAAGIVGYRSVIAKFSADGRLLWSNNWSWEENCICGIAMPDDNSVYIYGYIYSDLIPSTVYLLKYSADGRLIWQKALSDNLKEWYAESGCLAASALAVDKDGSAYASWTGLAADTYWAAVNGYLSPLPVKLQTVAVKGTEVDAKESAASPRISNAGKGRVYRRRTAYLAKVRAGEWAPPPSPAGYPSKLKAVPSSATGVSLTWEYSRGTPGDGYIVERRQQEDTDWVKAGEADDRCTFEDTGLKPSTVYVYRVKSFNASGYSTPSEEVSVKTFPDPTQSLAGVEWSKGLFLGGKGKFAGISQAGNGDIVAAGSSSKDLFLARYTPAGKLVWSRRFADPSKALMAPSFEWSCVTIDESGSIIAAGTVLNYDERKSDALVAKFTSDGRLVWAKTWGSNENDSIKAVTADADGNIYVAGETFGFDENKSTDYWEARIFLLKYSGGGKRLWHAVYGEDTVRGSVSWLSVGENGRILLGGHYDAPYYERESGPLLLEYDSEGRLKLHKYWKSREHESIQAVLPADDGALYLIGNGSGFERDKLLVLKYSPAEGVIWFRKYEPGGECLAAALVSKDIIITYLKEQPRILRISRDGKVQSGVEFAVNKDFEVAGAFFATNGSLYLVGNGVKPQYVTSAFSAIAADWEQKAATPTWPRGNQPDAGVHEAEQPLTPVSFLANPDVGNAEDNAYIIKLDYAKLSRGVSSSES